MAPFKRTWVAHGPAPACPIARFVPWATHGISSPVARELRPGNRPERCHARTLRQASNGPTQSALWRTARCVNCRSWRARWSTPPCRLDGPRERAPQVSFPALRRPFHGAPLRLPPGGAGGGPKRPRSPREADPDFGVFPCTLMEQSGCHRRIDRTSFQHHFSAPHRAPGRVYPATCGHRSHRTTPMALLCRIRPCPVPSQSALPPARHRAGPPGHIRISACGRDHEADLIE